MLQAANLYGPKSRDDEQAENPDQDLIKEIRNNFKIDQEHWRPIFEKATEDLYFLSDEKYAQWDEKDFNARSDIGRPALTVDQLSQFIHQVVNDIRMNTPSITVIPDNDDADVDTAEIIKGLVKNIEYKSRASDAYDIAALFSVKSSVAFIRVDHDYADDYSFNQELFIRRMINPGAVFLDSNSVEVDGRDAKRCTILEKITLSEYKSRWPGKEISDFDDAGRNFEKANDEEKITVAEYFELIETKSTKKANAAGEISDYDDGDEKAPDFKAKRTIIKCKVMRYWVSGKDFLEKTSFPGKFIPLIPVYGEEAWREGNRNLFSLIRKAKNAQQMYNYWKSLETELLQKQPIAPVMAAEGQVDDYKDDWANPSKAIVLRYKTIDADGNQIGAPQRLQPPTIPTGVVNAARETVDDIKAALGMYNASLGQRSNETSGVAINQRKQEGDVATFHFGDNLNRSICQVGNVVVFAAPEIYDTPRVIRISGDEGEQKAVGINGAQLQPGQEKPFDIRKGVYAVDIVTGASFTTKRQEAANFYQTVVTKMPELMDIMGDLLFKNMDFTGAQEMSARMKKIIEIKSPGLIESDDPNAAPPPDPKLIQATQMIQHLQTVIQQGGQQMQEIQQKLANREGETQVKMAAVQAKSQSEMAHAQNDQKENMMKMVQGMVDATMKSRELDIQEQQVSGTLAINAFTAKFDTLMQAMQQITAALPQVGIGAPMGAANPQANPAAAAQGEI